MELKRKKQMTYFTIGALFFLSGVEYAVILPTAYLYLTKRYHASTEAVGFLLASFSLSGLLAGPLMGRISDHTKNTRAVLIVANCFEIVGSVMYFLGISTWFLIASRFIAGVGTGVGACLFADIAKSTSVEERTGVMSLFMATRQFGLVIGPACNLFLRTMNFHIGPFVVDKLSSPGLFMAILWTLHQIFAIFLFWDLPKLKLHESLMRARAEYEENQENQTQEPSLHTPITQGPVTPESPPYDEKPPLPQPTPTPDLDMFTTSNEMIETVEQYMGVCDTQNTHNYGSINAYDEQQSRISPNWDDDHLSNNSITISCPTLFYNEFVKEDVVALLSITFVAFFNQCALEAMITPLTESLLLWEELENSLLFAGAGIEIILVFLLIRFLSRRFEDRVLLAFGFTIECLTVALLLGLLPRCIPGDIAMNLPLFITSVFCDVFGLPFLAVSSNSLYTKIMRDDIQGFAQGMRRSFVGCGTILGPLWSASLVSRHLYIMLGVMLGLNLVAVVMLILSFRLLRQPLSHPVSPPLVNSTDSEQRRLISPTC